MPSYGQPKKSVKILTQNEAQVLVVGAGPAGMAAARTAHDRGLKVIVIDKAVFPRDKTCGDGLTAQALRLLERLGVDVREIDDYLSIDEAVIVSPRGRQIVLPLPAVSEGIFSGVIPRAKLDAALLANTQNAGVEIREGVGIASLHENDLGITVGLSDGSEIFTQFIIAADGHWSMVRRLQEPEAPRDLGAWHAVRQYFSGVKIPHEKLAQWVFFEPDLLPGYAWMFPLPNGRANVGFTILRTPEQHGKELRALWEDLLKRLSLRTILGAEAEPEDSHRAWPIPANYSSERLAQARVLYTGDAAGVVDPLTGEGIAQALETGILAGESIGMDLCPNESTTRYRRAVERALGRDLRFARNFQRLLHSPRGAEMGLRLADLSPWTRRNFARWMFEDYPRAMVVTPGRWRRGMFTGTGAYAEIT